MELLYFPSIPNGDFPSQKQHVKENMMTSSKRLLWLVPMVAALSGCSAMVSFESTPPGADVYYIGGDKIGTTPFKKEIYDIFGYYSTYTFTAVQGDQKRTVSFQEDTLSKSAGPSPINATGALPPVINFDFSKP